MEEHSNTHRTPYLFNGKELDDETGLYYYGARYYDAQSSIWLSVDPMAEKYPGWSPYNYTLNNPVNYSDPDGRDPIFNRRGKLIGDDGNNNGAIHVAYKGKQARAIAKATSNGTKVISLKNIDKVTLQGGKSTVKGVMLLLKQLLQMDCMKKEGIHKLKLSVNQI